MTSKCGSADVLVELGMRIDCETAVMERALTEVGICFLFAQQYHQSMRHVAQVRRELGFRTIFNMLGPLANPAGASHQLIGVFRAELVETHAQVLARLGTVRALVVHGKDGLDEITTTGPTRVAEVADGAVRTYDVTPEDFGLPRASAADLAGGDAATNASIIEAILAGTGGARADIALLNAGAALYITGKAASIRDGIDLARAAVASGAAREKLDALRAMTSRQEAPK
jgi:anthranilate phosphoribosyltransferase